MVIPTTDKDGTSRTSSNFNYQLAVMTNFPKFSANIKLSKPDKKEFKKKQKISYML